MRVKTLIAAAFLSLGTGFFLAFPAGVMMSDSGNVADNQGVVILYSFENDDAGVRSRNPSAGFKRGYGLFNQGNSNGTLDI